MFIYENGNSLNLTFEGSMPVQNPEVVIKGFVNGATVEVNGAEVISVNSPEEFENKARLFVFQREGKLMITFNGVSGIDSPEVTIDEIEDNTYTVTANGESVTLVVADNAVTVQDAATEPSDPAGDEVVEETEDITEVEPVEDPEEE